MKYTDEWFIDEDFWKRFAPIIFNEKRRAEVPLVADSLIRLSGLNLNENEGKPGKPPRVLDLCCGYGRITQELARRGFCATGVDITAGYLETARKNADREKLAIKYIHEDVRNFKRKNAFCLTVNLYNSLGYSKNPSDDLLVLKNAHYSLVEGGTLIVDVLGKEIAVREFVETQWYEYAGYTVLTEYTPIDSWTSVSSRWILIKNNKRWEKLFVQRLYAASEFRNMLYAAGFSSVELYGGWDEECPYDLKSRNLIAVAKKGAKGGNRARK